MTPFSTESVSLGRPAICGEPGTGLGQGFPASRVTGGISISRPRALAMDFPLLTASPWRLRAGNNVGKASPPGLLPLPGSWAGYLTMAQPLREHGPKDTDGPRWTEKSTDRKACLHCAFLSSYLLSARLVRPSSWSPHPTDPPDLCPRLASAYGLLVPSLCQLSLPFGVLLRHFL